MKKDDKLNALFRRMDNDILNDIQSQLDIELSKSDEDFNPDKIAELSAMIAEIKGGVLSAEQKQNNINKITDEVMANQKRSRINRISKVLSTACACLLVIVCLNIYTMNTLGEDLFSAAIKMTQSGFSLDFSDHSGNPNGTEDLPTTTTADIYHSDCTTVTQQEELAMTTTQTDGLTTTTYEEEVELAATTHTAIHELPTTTTHTENCESPATTHTENQELAATTTMNNTEETVTTATCNSAEEVYISDCIVSVCSENNISVCNINNSFMPSVYKYEYSADSTEYSDDIYFSFTGDDIKFNVIIEQYRDKSKIPEMLIPSVNMNFETIGIPCGNAYIFTENNISTAVFSYNNCIYTLTVQSSDPKNLNIIKTAANGFIPYAQN